MLIRSPLIRVLSSSKYNYMMFELIEPGVSTSFRRTNICFYFRTKFTKLFRFFQKNVKLKGDPNGLARMKTKFDEFFRLS